MEKLICPSTGEECTSCTAIILNGAEIALVGRRDSTAARVIAEDVFDRAVGAVRAAKPDWAVQQGVISCKNRLSDMQELSADLALRDLVD